jgi:hypothetical protein
MKTIFTTLRTVVYASALILFFGWPALAADMAVKPLQLLTAEVVY